MKNDFEFSAELLSIWRQLRQLAAREHALSVDIRDTDKFRRLETRLDAEIALKPWEMSPLDVDDEPSPYPVGTGGYERWAPAQWLRRALDAAIKQK